MPEKCPSAIDTPKLRYEREIQTVLRIDLQQPFTKLIGSVWAIMIDSVLIGIDMLLPQIWN